MATFPINSLYIRIDDISPASSFGGTWEKIAENVVLPLGDNAPVVLNKLTTNAPQAVNSNNQLITNSNS